ncbi:hypothetical protein D9M73_120170 [compost metagenome]
MTQDEIAVGTVPDRKNQGSRSRHFTRYKPVQFALRPPFGEESRAYDDNAEIGFCQSAVDGFTQAVTNLH